jgi:hypothetical protein
MQVARLLLIHTGRYNDAVVRPYMAYATPETTMQLMEQTHGGSRIEMANMSGIAGQIIRPTSEPGGTVDIVGGWGSTRMRFMAEIHHGSMNGDVTVQYLTGYTDYDGVNATGQAVDPKMRFFINNSITTRRVRTMAGYGMENQLQVQDAAQILIGTPTTDYRQAAQSMHTMRPEDIFGTIGCLHDDHASAGGFFDMRSPFTGSSMKKSLRSNGSPTAFLSKTLKTYKGAMQAADVGADFSDLANTMAGMVAEPTITADPFIGAMTRFGTSLGEQNSFTYAELCGLCQETSHRTKVVMQSPAQRATLHQPGSSEAWTGMTHEVMIATMITHAAPAIMCDLMLTHASFSITNRNLGGQITLVPGNYQSFAEMNLSRHIQAFEARMVSEVFRDITRNNEIDIDLWCNINLLGDSEITVAYMGHPPVKFVAPSFADALTAPVVAYNLQNVQAMATDIDTIANSLSIDLGVHTAAPMGPINGPII